MNVDERINVNQLLERAGRPKLEAFSKLPPVRFDDVRSGILRIVDEDYDGSMVDYVRDLTRTVVALVDALGYVLSERDQLLDEDMYCGANCDTCAHCDCAFFEEPCSICCDNPQDDYAWRSNSQWEWRGLPKNGERS